MGRFKNSVISVLLIVFLLYFLSETSGMNVPAMFTLGAVVIIVLLAAYLLMAWMRH